jgi:peptidoglycan/LPS O-acetylase OafA/YrhL
MSQTEPAARRRDIQGLRGVAVLLVVAFHAGLRVPGGFVGVDVFFVISGFVITRLLLSELDRTGSIDLRRFYRRRARRLLPALAIVTLVTLIAAAVVLSPLGVQQTAAKTGLAASFFSANAALFLEPSGYFAAPAALNPFLHTWTLAVEEQFYLVFPGLLLLAAYIARRRAGSPDGSHQRRVIAAGLLLVIVVSYAGSAFFTFSHGPPLGQHSAAFAFYGSPTRAWEFATGALIALWGVGARRLRGIAATLIGVLGLILLAASAAWITETSRFPGTIAALPVAAAAMLIIAGSAAAPNPVSVALATRPLGWIGDLSYSWYLWHWPLIVFAHVLRPNDRVWLVGAGVVSLLPAWVSYRFVENPIRTNPRWVGRRVLVLSLGCVLLPAAAAASLQKGSNVATFAVRQMRAQFAAHLDEAEGCTQNLPSDRITRATCTWPRGVSIGRRSVVLIGDSNAGQFSEAVLPAARAIGRPLTLATRSGCPFVNVLLHRPGYDTASCHRFVIAWVAALRASRPALVIIASASSDYFIKSQGWSFSTPAGGPSRSGVESKARLWEDGTRFVAQAIAGSGVPVVLVHTLPHFVNWDPHLCSAWTVYSDTTACGRTTPLAEIQASQSAAFNAEEVAVEQLRGVSTLDLSHAICSKGICRTNVGNRWLYKDGGHITVGEARLLQPEFARLVRQHMRR